MNDRLSVAFLEETNACFKTRNELTTDRPDLLAKLLESWRMSPPLLLTIYFDYSVLFTYICFMLRSITLSHFHFSCNLVVMRDRQGDRGSPESSGI